MQDVLDLHKEMQFNYPVLEGTQKIIEDYGNFNGIPTSFLVGKDGLLREIIPGMVDEKSLQASIQEALKGK
jgi:hypothetical protein